MPGMSGTPTAGGISQATADAAYLKLAGSNGVSLGGDGVTAPTVTFVDSSNNTLNLTALGPSSGTARSLTISAAGLTGNRVRTLLDANGVEVLDTAAQTLTNKTLTSPTLNSPVINTEPGYVALNAAYTNATTTFSNTALSVSVVSGRTYSFRVVLFVADSTAADGIKVDFNGGSAAATDFRAHATLFDTALLLSTQVTALATSISQATVTGNGMFECYGTFVPSSSGTFIVRAAQNAHTAGTLTIQRGSHLQIKDVNAV